MTTTLPFKILIAAACVALANAASIPRDSCTQIEFCTQSVYATGACPYATPTSGGGTCDFLDVSPNVCYTFTDFPNAPASLINNVNYIFIPNGTITECDLYKTTNCTVGPDQEWDACETGSTDLLCRKHLAGDVNSWICS